MARHIVTAQMGELVGANIVPVYNKDLCTSLYGQHINYILLVTRQADVMFQSVYGEGISKEEIGYVSSAMLIMFKNGLIEVSADAPKEVSDFMKEVTELNSKGPHQN
jgi:hypothetical protein